MRSLICLIFIFFVSLGYSKDYTLLFNQYDLERALNSYEFDPPYRFASYHRTFYPYQVAKIGKEVFALRAKFSASRNSFVMVKKILRNELPYVYRNSKDRFLRKLIRYVLDSNILNLFVQRNSGHSSVKTVAKGLNGSFSLFKEIAVDKYLTNHYGKTFVIQYRPYSDLCMTLLIHLKPGDTFIYSSNSQALCYPIGAK